MRKSIIGLLLGCGLTAASVLPVLACSMQDQASASQDQQQTAQAQPSSQTTTQ